MGWTHLQLHAAMASRGAPRCTPCLSAMWRLHCHSFWQACEVSPVLTVVTARLCACSCKTGKGKPDEYYFNPLKCPLPKAPSMEMYCLYGVGIPTERSYYYLNLESEEVSTCLALLLAVLRARNTALQSCRMQASQREDVGRPLCIISQRHLFL